MHWKKAAAGITPANPKATTATQTQQQAAAPPMASPTPQTPSATAVVPPATNATTATANPATATTANAADLAPVRVSRRLAAKHESMDAAAVAGAAMSPGTGRSSSQATSHAESGGSIVVPDAVEMLVFEWIQ